MEYVTKGLQPEDALRYFDSLIGEMESLMSL